MKTRKKTPMEPKLTLTQEVLTHLTQTDPRNLDFTDTVYPVCPTTCSLALAAGVKE